MVNTSFSNVTQQHSQSHVICLPNLWCPCCPLPVHFITAKCLYPIDRHQLDVIQSKSLDKQAGNLGFAEQLCEGAK